MPGDLIHSPLQTRYPELSPRFDVDGNMAAKTRRSLLDRYCDTRTLCCTGHFPSPSIGRIKRWDDGFAGYIDDYVEARPTSGPIRKHIYKLRRRLDDISVLLKSCYRNTLKLRRSRHLANVGLVVRAPTMSTENPCTIAL